MAKLRKIARFAVRYLCAAFSCLYLFTIGFLFRRNHLLLFRICAHFGFYREPSEETPTVAPAREIIPEVKLSDLIPGDMLVRIREPLGPHGSPSTLELVVINQLIRQNSPANLFELGTFDGRTTLNMACNSPEDAKVYTLDLPKESQRADYWEPSRDLWSKNPVSESSNENSEDQRVTIGSMYLGSDCEAKIVQLYGDSATFDFSPYLNSMDFVFIDASHEYQTKLSDSKTALKLLRNGEGIILWHDYREYAFEEGVKALNECYSEIKGFEDLRHIEGTTMICLVAKGRERLRP